MEEKMVAMYLIDFKFFKRLTHMLAILLGMVICTCCNDNLQKDIVVFYDIHKKAINEVIEYCLALDATNEKTILHELEKLDIFKSILNIQYKRIRDYEVITTTQYNEIHKKLNNPKILNFIESNFNYNPYLRKYELSERSKSIFIIEIIHNFLTFISNRQIIDFDVMFLSKFSSRYEESRKIEDLLFNNNILYFNIYKEPKYLLPYFDVHSLITDGSNLIYRGYVLPIGLKVSLGNKQDVLMVQYSKIKNNDCFIIRIFFML
jgi:hypothetical protein